MDISLCASPKGEAYVSIKQMILGLLTNYRSAVNLAMLPPEAKERMGFQRERNSFRSL